MSPKNILSPRVPFWCREKCSGAIEKYCQMKEKIYRWGVNLQNDGKYMTLSSIRPLFNLLKMWWQFMYSFQKEQLW